VKVLAIAVVLAAALVVVAGIAVGLRARRIKVRHRAVFSAELPALDPGRERVVDAPRALYHGTRFADGVALLAPKWRDPCVGDLWCTDQAIFLRREEGGDPLALPLAWVLEATLIRAHAPLAGKDLPMLRVRWRRGGEELATDFSLPGGMANLEKLRREIHLRQAEGSVLAALGPLLARTPEPGAGTKE
jgi:hypothetical protein